MANKKVPCPGCGGLKKKCAERCRSCTRVPREDIIGRVFGGWKVISLSHRAETGREDQSGGGGHLYYWNAQCLNCGVVAKRAKTTLMGMIGCSNCDGLPKGSSGLRKVMIHYKRNAERSGRAFAFSEEEFRKITILDCHYCGSPPSRVSMTNKGNASKKSHWGDYVYNGIDRIDNNLGYVAGNCVPCCLVCNRAKNSMIYEEFVLYLNQIAVFRGMELFRKVI